MRVTRFLGLKKKREIVHWIYKLIKKFLCDGDGGRCWARF